MLTRRTRSAAGGGCVNVLSRGELRTAMAEVDDASVAYDAQQVRSPRMDPKPGGATAAAGKRRDGERQPIP